mmetsp:Transcript_11954/g.24894  ORF Transcript_11954/g.24894 Transcript_11954/m.24894 type:complete len:84 (+) Transcript_11954:203-454(+)
MNDDVGDPDEGLKDGDAIVGSRLGVRVGLPVGSGNGDGRFDLVGATVGSRVRYVRAGRSAGLDVGWNGAVPTSRARTIPRVEP